MLTTDKKMYIIFFGLAFIIYIGAAVTAGAYLWLSTIILIFAALFAIEGFLIKRLKSGKLFRFFPLLFFAFFIYANETSKALVAENPYEVSVYYDEVFESDRVLIKYGLYNSVSLAEKNIGKTSSNVELTPNGYILTRSYDIKLDFYTYVYIIIGIPLFLITIIRFLSETRTNPYANKKGGKESVVSVLWGASHAMNTSNHRTAHISQDQNFLDEKSKSDMIKDKERG